MDVFDRIVHRMRVADLLISNCHLDEETRQFFNTKLDEFKCTMNIENLNDIQYKHGYFAGYIAYNMDNISENIVDLKRQCLVVLNGGKKGDE